MRRVGVDLFIPLHFWLEFGGVSNLGSPKFQISRWAGLNPWLKKNTGFLMEKNILLLPMFFCSAGAGAVFFLDRDEIEIIE